MGEYCFSLHPSVSACLVGPHVAGVPSYFLWNLWVKVKKTTEKAITRSKDTEKAVEYRILIIEEQYSSYLLPISIKWWPFRSYSVAFSNNLKPQKAFSSSSALHPFLPASPHFLVLSTPHHQLPDHYTKILGQPISLCHLLGEAKVRDCVFSIPVRPVSNGRPGTSQNSSFHAWIVG